MKHNIIFLAASQSPETFASKVGFMFKFRPGFRSLLYFSNTRLLIFREREKKNYGIRSTLLYLVHLYYSFFSWSHSNSFSLVLIRCFRSATYFTLETQHYETRFFLHNPLKTKHVLKKHPTEKLAGLSHSSYPTFAIIMCPL